VSQRPAVRGLTGLALAVAWAGWSPTTALGAQDAAEASVRVGGFFSTTLFTQDALFSPGNGQNAQLVVREQDGPDGWWHGADVRNTRLLIDVDAGAGGAWQVGGLLELDLFGGFPSGAAFSREQAYLRLRLAYAEFERGPARVRLGQDWAPISHDMPLSVNRLAFPPGWGAAAVIGWRFPGAFLRYRLSEGPSASVSVEAAIMRGAGFGDAADAERPATGQTRLVPQLQGVVVVEAPGDAPLDWGLRFGGHVDAQRGAGLADVPADDGWALSLSGSVAPGPVTLLAGGYVGRAVGHLAALASQVEALRGQGAWGQVGVDFAEPWGARLFAGFDAPRDADVLELEEGILHSRTATLELFRDVGAYALAVEWQHTRTSWWHRPSAARPVLRGNQLALGALVRF